MWEESSREISGEELQLPSLSPTLSFTDLQGVFFGVDFWSEHTQSRREPTLVVLVARLPWA
jgi:hypothetical protein